MKQAFFAPGLQFLTLEPAWGLGTLGQTPSVEKGLATWTLVLGPGAWGWGDNGIQRGEHAVVWGRLSPCRHSLAPLYQVSGSLRKAWPDLGPANPSSPAPHCLQTSASTDPTAPRTPFYGQEGQVTGLSRQLSQVEFPLPSEGFWLSLAWR